MNKTIVIRRFDGTERLDRYADQPQAPDGYVRIAEEDTRFPFVCGGTQTKELAHPVIFESPNNPIIDAVWMEGTDLELLVGAPIGGLTPKVSMKIQGGQLLSRIEYRRRSKQRWRIKTDSDLETGPFARTLHRYDGYMWRLVEESEGSRESFFEFVRRIREVEAADGFAV